MRQAKRVSFGYSPDLQSTDDLVVWRALKRTNTRELLTRPRRRKRASADGRSLGASAPNKGGARARATVFRAWYAAVVQEAQ